MLSCRLAMAQSPTCGVSSFNFLRAYSETGEQLIGTEWVAQLYFGYPEEDQSQFRALPGILHALPNKFWPPRGYQFEPPRYPFLQFQLRFWNTNTAPSWEEAVSIAKCDSEHRIGESMILKLNPWKTQCDCGLTVCSGITFFDHDPFTIVLSPVPPELRLRHHLSSSGLGLKVCHRGASTVVFERSRDLENWEEISDLIAISDDEYLVPTVSLVNGTFYRCHVR